VRKSAPRSTTIMAGGDPTDSLYIVLSGRLKVMMSDSEGKEVILAILGPGEFFGEMGLIDDEPRSRRDHGRALRAAVDRQRDFKSAWPRTSRWPRR
jgi:CRP-like cAMP-binding protein